MSVVTRPRPGSTAMPRTHDDIPLRRRRRLPSLAMDRAGRRARSSPAGVDRIGRIRAEIEAGCYMTPHRIGVTVDRMLADVLGGA